LLYDPEKAAAQALGIVNEGEVVAQDRSVLKIEAQTICIHGDTPGAGRIAEAVRRRLEETGVVVGPLVV